MRRKLLDRLGALITAILLLFPLSVLSIGADNGGSEVGNAYQTYFFSDVKTVGENLLDSAEWVDRDDYSEYQLIHSTAWIELQPGRTYYLHMDFALHPVLFTGKNSNVYYYSPTMNYTDISDGKLLIHTRKEGATFIEIGRYFSDQDLSDWEIYAVSSYLTAYDVSKTNFQTDAQNLFPEIDLSAYTGSSADYIEMITMHEDQPELYPNISVFLYLFNPSGKRVTGGSFSFLSSHSATLSVVGEATSDPRFVKFKVDGWGCRYQIVDGVENKHIRRYDVGDVSLRYADGSSERFAYEGYFVIEDQFDATGAVTSYKVGSHFDSRVELDFDYTYYRTDTSTVGAYYHNQVDSIYFNIPNRLREDYGKLVDVKVSYRKARMRPVVVVDDQTLYDAFYKGIGKAMDGSDTSVPGFYTDAYFNNSMTTCSYGDSYNVKLGTQNLTYFHSSNEIPVLYSLFMAEDVSAGIRAEASSVDWETILAWLYAQTNPMQESYVMGASGPISTKFFSSVDSDVTVLNVASLDLSANTFKSNHGFFTEWATYGFAYACNGISTDVDLDLTDKILEIGKISQISGNSDRLYYAACDENDLKDCFRKSQTDDSTMYLVRFNVSQYLEKPITIEYNGHSYTDAGYFFEEDVYLNYHILELSFESDNETITHVPVVTEGKDFGGDGTVEKDPTDIRDQATTELKESLFDQFKKILGLILGIAVVILIAVFVVPVIMPLLKTVGNALGSFFRWIGDKLRGASTKRKQRKNNRK